MLSFILNIFNKKSPKQIVKYIQKVHKKGWQKIIRMDSEIVLSHSKFILKEIPLDSTEVKWVDFVCHYNSAVNYSKLTTPAPPIVVDFEGNIIDGEHRSLAAKLRGDKTIKAYIGIK
jgi:hypothetical protein